MTVSPFRCDRHDRVDVEEEHGDEYTDPERQRLSGHGPEVGPVKAPGRPGKAAPDDDEHQAKGKADRHQLGQGHPEDVSTPPEHSRPKAQRRQAPKDTDATLILHSLEGPEAPLEACDESGNEGGSPHNQDEVTFACWVVYGENGSH